MYHGMQVEVTTAVMFWIYRPRAVVQTFYQHGLQSLDIQIIHFEDL